MLKVEEREESGREGKKRDGKIFFLGDIQG